MTTHSDVTVLQKEEKLAASLAEVEKKMIEVLDVNMKYAVLYEQANIFSSKVGEEESKIRDWEAKTMSLHEILENSKTAKSNNVLLWINIQLDTAPETCIHERANEHVLFDVCWGVDNVIGPKESRRGGKK